MKEAAQRTLAARFQIKIVVVEVYQPVMTCGTNMWCKSVPVQERKGFLKLSQEGETA